MTPTPVSPGIRPEVLVDKYAINDSGTEVKVWGHADKNVDGPYVVLIGPKPPVGFWPGFTNVFNQQWEADVPTDPQISRATKYGPTPRRHSQRRCRKPECFEVHLPGDRIDNNTTITSGPANELRGATRPQLLQGPGIRTAIGLPIESMTT